MRPRNPSTIQRAFIDVFPFASIVFMICRTFLVAEAMLPIAAGATAAGASTETTTEVSAATTTSSATAVAEATTAAAAKASAHHVAEQQPEPATAAATAEREQEEDEEEDEAEPVGVVARALVVVDGFGGLLGRSEGDVGVGCDDVGDLLDAGLDGGAVLALLQERVHAAADVAYLGVVEDAFEAVADFDAVLVVLKGEDED